MKCKYCGEKNLVKKYDDGIEVICEIKENSFLKYFSKHSCIRVIKDGGKE